MAFTKPDRESIERGVELFNSGRFFDAHEAWEGSWLRREESREKDFLQGLIMAAGAFHHYERRECTGAAELLARSITMLKAAQDVYPGVDTASFIDALTLLGDEFSRCTFSVPVPRLPQIARCAAAFERAA